MVANQFVRGSINPRETRSHLQIGGHGLDDRPRDEVRVGKLFLASCSGDGCVQSGTPRVERGDIQRPEGRRSRNFAAVVHVLGKYGRRTLQNDGALRNGCWLDISACLDIHSTNLAPGATPNKGREVDATLSSHPSRKWTCRNVAADWSGGHRWPACDRRSGSWGGRR